MWFAWEVVQAQSTNRNQRAAADPHAPQNAYKQKKKLNKTQTTPLKGGPHPQSSMFGAFSPLKTQAQPQT